MRVMVLMDGGALPLSKRAIADCVVPMRCANSAWYSPARVRALIQLAGKAEFIFQRVVFCLEHGIFIHCSFSSDTRVIVKPPWRVSLR